MSELLKKKCCCVPTVCVVRWQLCPCSGGDDRGLPGAIFTSCSPPGVLTPAVGTLIVRRFYFPGNAGSGFASSVGCYYHITGDPDFILHTMPPGGLTNAIAYPTVYEVCEDCCPDEEPPPDVEYFFALHDPCICPCFPPPPQVWVRCTADGEFPPNMPPPGFIVAAGYCWRQFTNCFGVDPELIDPEVIILTVDDLDVTQSGCDNPPCCECPCVGHCDANHAAYCDANCPNPLSMTLAWTPNTAGDGEIAPCPTGVQTWDIQLPKVSGCHWHAFNIAADDGSACPDELLEGFIRCDANGWEAFFVIQYSVPVEGFGCTACADDTSGINTGSARFRAPRDPSGVCTCPPSSGWVAVEQNNVSGATLTIGAAASAGGFRPGTLIGNVLKAITGGRLRPCKGCQQRASWIDRAWRVVADRIKGILSP